MVLIVGFEEQHGTRAQRLRPLHIIPVFRMPFGLGKKLRRSGATHRMQLRFPALQAGFALFRIGINLPQIYRCDHCYRFDIRVVTGLISSNEPAEAVSDQDQQSWIPAILCGIRRLAQEAYYLSRVLNGRRLGERSRHAPGPAIMEEHNVPPRSPDGLCQVSVHLITRQTVRENHRAAWACAARNVEPRVQFHAVTQHYKLGKPRREFLIGWFICYDSRRCLLRPRMCRCPQDPEQSDNDHPLPQLSHAATKDLEAASTYRHGRFDGARGGSRTHMRKNPRRILSPQRLPFRHPGIGRTSKLTRRPRMLKSNRK